MTSFKTTLTLLTISLLGNAAILSAQQDDKDQFNQEKTSPTPEPNTEPAKLIAKKNNLPVKGMSGTLFFTNGDSISGQLSDWNLETIALTSRGMLEPITFSSEHITNIVLDDKKIAQEANESEDLTTLRLQHRNGQKGLNGVIKGSFSDIDDTHITLNTNYAGKIKVLKKFTTKMEVDSKKGYLYMGPNSLEEWNSNNIVQSWEYLNQSLISRKSAANIAKDIKIPDSAVISFDLSWKKDEMLDLYLYSSDPTQARPDNYYKFSIRNLNKMNVQKYVSGIKRRDVATKLEKNIRNFGMNQRLTKTNSAIHAHYDIYMSKTKGEFHIFKNGKKINSFVDGNPQPKNFGSALHLISSHNTAIRVKNLTLARWSGNFPTDTDEQTFADLKGDGQRILLKNGDIFIGKVEAVTEGKMKIETLYTPLNLPILRIRSIDLTSSEKKEEPLMKPADIKCWFKDEGWIILEPLSINGSKLTAYHQALGKNEFDLNTFKRIDLNIYETDVISPNSPEHW